MKSTHKVYEKQIISSLLACSRVVRRRAGPLSHISTRLILDTVAVQD